jgi:hypothetical protein
MPKREYYFHSLIKQLVIGIFLMHPPCTISLFLADGTADGLKIIEKSNWNGCGLACPKKVLFERHRKRSELTKPGVYLLVGENDKTH